MKHRFQILLLVLILYGIAGSWSAVFEPAIANAATKENLKKSSPEIQLEEGYIPLFQNDLSNAIVEPGGWVFENGNLTPAGKGHIWTKERYGDFVLKLEFKTTETTESGVFLRCDMIKNWLNWTIEVQIQQAIVEFDKYNCGAIFDILAPSKNMIKRPGDWNSYTISCKGNLVDVILNGELVSRMDLNFFDVGHKTLDGTRSKLETPFADLSREGHIGFQYNGQPVWFRNIRIKPLEDIHLTDASLPSKSASKAAEILFYESDGICIMEAEHGLISQNLDWINWEKKTDASASNGEYMTTPLASERAWKWKNACELAFPVHINTPGKYRVAIRLIANSKTNSAQWGVDGRQIRGVAFRDLSVGWSWVRSKQKVNLASGSHTINIRRNKPGLKIDQVMLALNTENIPQPARSLTPSIEPPQGYGQAWPMHELDNPHYRLPNGLDPADVNQDGLLDFVTNYETKGQVRIAIHPGLNEVRQLWSGVDISEETKVSGNAESVAFGDFDGDGQPDVVVAMGSEKDDKVGGLFVLWCPPPDKVADSRSWKENGLIPSSKNVGHIHYVKSRDVNGDGAVDIVAGGRLSEINKTFAGLKWFAAPKDLEKRRNLTQWSMHVIDAALLSGHGFEFGDLDGDGDEDVAVANADWDTPDEEEKVIWYENPGEGTPAQKLPWPKHIIYQGPEFYPKPQVDIADIDGDGHNDIVTPTEEAIYYFRNTGSQPPVYERIVINKPPVTKWLQRGIKVVDVNNDGRPDIAGMLIWDIIQTGQWEGFNTLPRDKSAVFWMEYSGDKPSANNWTTHVVKWGDGCLGWQHGLKGEKWDQMIFDDVDKDGDLDIVANCEEYDNRYQVYLAVVWFENQGP